jgi:4-alpha-glucanotransferase
LIELAYSSRAELAIVQAQDVLGLGGEARMNRPGQALGNWRWRLEPGALTREHALRLRALAERYAR